MRLLPLLALAALVAGCVDAPAAVDEAAAPLPGVPPGLRLSAHRAGAAIPVEEGAAALGGAVEVVSYLVGAHGGEPSVGVTSTGAAFVEADDYAMRSRDGGVTWEVVYDFGPAIAGRDVVSNSDPFLYVDPASDRVHMPTMWPILVCSEGIWSDDDGETWTDKPMSCGLPGVDHQKMGSGPYVEGSPFLPNPVTAYPSVVYYCYSKVVTQHCAVSVDGGISYVYDTVVDAQVCPGPGGPPATSPAGTVFLPLGGLGGCNRVAIGVSLDNGFTWTVKTPDVGDLGQTEIDPDIAVTPDGTAYYAFRAAKDNAVYLVSSTDNFNTIRGPWRVAPPDVLSTNFVAVVAGDDGRVAVAYLGTRDTAKFADAAPDDARWHMFVTFAFDAGSDEPTFVTAQANPEEDPVQIGSIHYGGGGPPDRNLLDFIDAARGPDGRVYVAYTDGCVEKCAFNPAAKPGDSRSREVAVAVLRSGPSLFADKGILGPVAAT